MSKYTICPKRKVILLYGRKMSNRQILKALRHKEKRPKTIFRIIKYKFQDFGLKIYEAFEGFIEVDVRRGTKQVVFYKADAIALAKHFKLTEKHLRCEK